MNDALHPLKAVFVWYANAYMKGRWHKTVRLFFFRFRTRKEFLAWILIITMSEQQLKFELW